MSNIWMYAHGGSGNHGCEAIVRSTLYLLNSFPGERYLISASPNEDQKYGLDKLCLIKKDVNPWSRKTTAFLNAYLALKVKKDYVPLDSLNYKQTIDCVQRGDIALSIGGDNYCYADADKYIMLHDMLLKRGAKTVLWGCSVEPELLNDKSFAKDISRYSLITARETISYSALKKVNPKTILVSDSAFFLKTVERPLPSGFVAGQYVGINVSPMVIEKEITAGIVLDEYKSLIQYIFDNSDMKVLLIPHVVWDKGDDRTPLTELYSYFASTGRIAIAVDCNCEEIKGLISRSRFFIGARTHATIAAYSSFVPTLVVGYSVKARGIAKDLFGEEDHFVIPVQNLCKRGQLVRYFEWIMDHEYDIKCKLEKQVPAVMERTKSGLKELESLI